MGQISYLSIGARGAAVFFLPFRKKTGRALLRQSRLQGNFYKCCEDPACRHFGSFYPARFPDHALEEKSLGGYEIVDY